MALLSGGHKGAQVFSDAFKTGFAIGQTKKKEKKEDAVSEAYSILGEIGGEAEYDTITDEGGQPVSAIPQASQQVQQLRGQALDEGPTQQQQMLADQAGTVDVPKKISLTDHMENRKRAREIMRKAKVSGKEQMQFDDDYTAQMNKSARKYRDLAANAWAAGNFDAAARYIESAYQYIADGSDVRAEFIPDPATGRPMLAMGFVDSITGETSQEKPMLIDSPEKFAVMSEKAMDYGTGLGMQKDLLGLKIQEDTNARQQGKYDFWDITKDDDRRLGHLFKLAGVENAVAQSQLKLMSSFKDSKTAKDVLAREKNLLSEIKARYEGGDEAFADPATRQDIAATASAINRLTGEGLSASEIIETSKYATTTVNNIDARIREQMDKDPANQQLTAGARRTKAMDFKKQIMHNEGFLRYGEDGTVEMRSNATDDNWIPAPPRLYGGTPIVTQYSSKTALMGLIANKAGDSATINEIRKILNMPDYTGGGTSVAAITSGRAAPAKADPVTPRPNTNKPPKEPVPTSRIDPNKVALPMGNIKPKGKAVPEPRTTTERRAIGKKDKVINETYNSVKDIIRQRQYTRLTPELQIKLFSQRDSQGRTVVDRLSPKERKELEAMLQDYARNK